jgi:hypothetical protein
MVQNYTFLCRIKTLCLLKVAKSNDFNEFRSFYVLKSIEFGRIHKKESLAKADARDYLIYY